MVTKEQLIANAAEIKRLGNLLAEAKGKFHNLKEIGSDILATGMSEIDKIMTGKTSEAKLERYARSSDEWGKYQVGLNYARQEFLKLDAQYTSACILQETLRSILSLEKTEMSIL